MSKNINTSDNVSLALSGAVDVQLDPINIRPLPDRGYGPTRLFRILLTNACAFDCDYCPMRRDNTRQNTSYILEPATILSAARAIRDAGTSQCSMLLHVRVAPAPHNGLPPATLQCRSAQSLTLARNAARRIFCVRARPRRNALPTTAARRRTPISRPRHPS